MCFLSSQTPFLGSSSARNKPKSLAERRQRRQCNTVTHAEQANWTGATIREVNNSLVALGSELVQLPVHCQHCPCANNERPRRTSVRSVYRLDSHRTQRSDVTSLACPGSAGARKGKVLLVSCSDRNYFSRRALAGRTTSQKETAHHATLPLSSPTQPNPTQASGVEWRLCWRNLIMYHASDDYATVDLISTTIYA